MGKEGFRTVAYQLAVDHTGFARGVTVGLTGAKYDETIMQYNGAIQKIRHDPKYTLSVINKLVDYEGNEYTKKGTYIIGNGGYHKWRCTISPFKASITRAQVKGTERLESVGKGVECFLGRTKGRWRI
ncbi:unnamed protein product, partial [Discosporangium mesarthrocarpum]